MFRLISPQRQVLLLLRRLELLALGPRLQLVLPLQVLLLQVPPRRGLPLLLELPPCSSWQPPSRELQAPLGV